MTDSEILKKAIEKAVKGGCNFGSLVHMSLGYQTKVGATFEEWLWDFDTYRVIIFSHDFAKAFFGSELVEKDYAECDDNNAFGGILYYPYCEGAEIEYKGVAWKYHLQEMVLQENPIQYLEAFL